MIKSIKIGDKFKGKNGIFLVTDIYVAKNKYWVEVVHLDSGNLVHTDYDYFSQMLVLEKLDWQYNKDATDEDYQDIRKECIRMLEDNMIGGFGRINFIDYSKYIKQLLEEFPTLIFKIESFGLNVDKKEQ